MLDATGRRSKSLKDQRETATQLLKQEQARYETLKNTHAKEADSVKVQAKQSQLKTKEIQQAESLRKAKEAIWEKAAKQDDRDQKKNTAAATREILDNLNLQVSLKEELFRIDKQMISARGEEKTSLQKRKDEVQKELDTANDQFDVLLDQNGALEESFKIQTKRSRMRAKALQQEKALTAEQEKQKQKENERGKAMEQVLKTLTSLVTMYATRALTTFWSEAVEYSSKYYDQLNEIRIVTNATEEEAARMGAAYRDLAESMSVSSTDIATAAVEFWRQG